MKTTISTFILALTAFAFTTAQQSMNISHAGISPESEITVAPGELIEFIYGGGGPHPMTEGWNSGESSTPVSFETVTVTSASPSVTFSLDQVGTYYFHCGTNPGNSNNWGKINVVDSTSAIDCVDIHPQIALYPNPAVNTLNITGDFKGAVIADLSGKTVINIQSSTTDISALKPGTYVVLQGDSRQVFIKK